MISPEKLDWKTEYHGRVVRTDGSECEMWVIVWTPEIMVSVGVPVGRGDIVNFIVERCKTQ